MSCVSVNVDRIGRQSARNVADCKSKCAKVAPDDNVGVFYNQTTSSLECRCNVLDLLRNGGATDEPSSLCQTKCPDGMPCGGFVVESENVSYFSVYAPDRIAPAKEEDGGWFTPSFDNPKFLQLLALGGAIVVLVLMSIICCVISRRRRDTKQRKQIKATSLRNEQAVLASRQDNSIYYSKSIASCHSYQPPPLTMDTMFFSHDIKSENQFAANLKAMSPRSPMLGDLYMRQTNTHPLPRRGENPDAAKYQTSEQWSKTFRGKEGPQSSSESGPVAPKRKSHRITSTGSIFEDPSNNKWIPSDEHERASKPQSKKEGFMPAIDAMYAGLRKQAVNAGIFTEPEPVVNPAPKQTNIPMFLQFTKLPVPPAAKVQDTRAGEYSDDESNMDSVSSKWYRKSFASIFSVNPKRLDRKDTTGTMATVIDVGGPEKRTAPAVKRDLSGFSPIERDLQPVAPPRVTSD
jgi:hypothetical protein